MTAQKLLFTKKLDVINDEFDNYIGALVADQIFKSHILRSQQQRNLDMISAGSKEGNERGMAQNPVVATL